VLDGTTAGEGPAEVLLHHPSACVERSRSVTLQLERRCAHSPQRLEVPPLGMSALPYLDLSHGFEPLGQFGTFGGLIKDIRWVRIGSIGGILEFPSDR